MSIEFLLSEIDLYRASVASMSVQDLIVKCCQREADLSREEILSAIEKPKNIKFTVGEYDFSFNINA